MLLSSLSLMSFVYIYIYLTHRIIINYTHIPAGFPVFTRFCYHSCSRRPMMRKSGTHPCDPAHMGHRHCQHTARCFGIPSDAWGSLWKQLLYGTSWNRQFNPFQFISLLLHFSLRSCALSAHIPVEKEQGCHGGFHTNIRDLSNPKYQVTNERMSLEDSYTRWYEPVAAV